MWRLNCWCRGQSKVIVGMSCAKYCVQRSMQIVKAAIRCPSKGIGPSLDPFLVVKSKRRKSERRMNERRKSEQRKSERRKSEQRKSDRRKSERLKTERRKSERRKSERLKSDRRKRERRRNQRRKSEQSKSERRKSERRKSAQGSQTPLHCMRHRHHGSYEARGRSSQIEAQSRAAPPSKSFRLEREREKHYR